MNMLSDAQIEAIFKHHGSWAPYSLAQARVLLAEQAGQPIIRLNHDKTLDEVYVVGAAHLEQMSATHWWLGLNYEGGMVHVNLHSKATIKANFNNERDSDFPPEQGSAPE